MINIQYDKRGYGFPDKIEFMGKEYNFLSNDALTFSYFIDENKVGISDYGEVHLRLFKKIGLDPFYDTRNRIDGRLWTESKIIAFWASSNRGAASSSFPSSLLAKKISYSLSKTINDILNYTLIFSPKSEDGEGRKYDNGCFGIKLNDYISYYFSGYETYEDIMNLMKKQTDIQSTTYTKWDKMPGNSELKKGKIGLYGMVEWLMKIKIKKDI